MQHTVHSQKTKGAKIQYTQEHVSLPPTIRLVDVGNLRHKRIIWIWVCQQGANGQENLQHKKCVRLNKIQIIFKFFEGNSRLC